jgi:hypothetical protein
MHPTPLETTAALLAGRAPPPAPSNQPATPPAQSAEATSAYITADVAAAILSVSPRTLERFRMIGGGPKWTTVGRGGRGVRYRRDWLDQWLESRVQGAAA